jgi:hypothetical protein
MRIRTLIAAAGLAALGTVALARNVTCDFDRTADFKAFRT